MTQSTTVRVSVQSGADTRVSVRVRPATDPPTRRSEPLAVRLPDIPTVPEVWRGATYVLRKLLGAGDTNPKLRKSNAAGTPFQTWGLALAPAKESGFQLCSSSSPACRETCLYRQGHARLDSTISACRVAKSVALREHPDWFASQLRHELGVIRRRADAGGFRVAVRLNLTSDVAWERTLPEVFWRFPEFQMYDYSKHFERVMRFLCGDLPPNYHLTFSRSEHNEVQCRDVLDAGGNVAVVFRGREFPTRFLGYPVIDGDETDLRFMDPAGVVVALSAKGTAKADTTGFVVDTDRPRLALHTV